jgi:hypothetical protein
MLKLLPVLILTLLLGGCSGLSWTTAGKIIPPINHSCPLEGKWTVLEDLHSAGHLEVKNHRWTGDSALFSPEVAMLGNYVWKNPNYKIKQVNSTDYIMTKYLSLSSSLVPNNKEVEVVTVSTADNFLGEFMKINDTKIIAFIQNNVLLLQKVSDKITGSVAGTTPNDLISNSENNAGASGVFLGLKIPQKNHDYVYQTLWLAADDKKLHPLLIENNIFFPRSSGFWELQVKNIRNGQSSEDKLFAHDVSNKVIEIPSRSNENIRSYAPKETHQRIIDYIGNDYAAIENDINGVDQLQVLPVDKISAQEGINVSDLLGTGGLKIYNSARKNALQFLNNEGITSVNNDRFEENFGLTRKNGHWYLQGRINYQKDNQPQYMDYSINVIPPAKLIYYDTLCLSWQNIKDRVPDALDAFTSPNRDIALIKTENSLDVFGISSDQLDSEPLARIKLKKGESVVMAEWATGSYVDNWEKAFLANGAKVMSQ